MEFVVTLRFLVSVVNILTWVNIRVLTEDN